MKKLIIKLILKVFVMTKKPFILFDKSNFKIAMYEGIHLYIVKSNDIDWIKDTLYVIDTVYDISHKKPLTFYKQ